MNKDEFIKRVSECSNLSKKKCEQVLNNCYKLICKSLCIGESLNFKGFGKFYIKTTKERVVKNVFTKELTLVRQKNIVNFKISSAFKNIVK